MADNISGTTVSEGINPSAVITGAKVRFLLGDVAVGYAQAVNYTINHELVPVYGLDRLCAYEYAEVGYSCTFSVSRFRVPKTSAASTSASVNSLSLGSPVELGWQSKVQGMLTQGCIRAEIYDKSGEQMILKVDGVKLTSRSGTISARDLATETLDFVGLIAYDEAGEQTMI